MGRAGTSIRRSGAVIAFAAAALTGCGSDDDESGDNASEEPTSASGETCAESFNADAPDNFPLIIRLSHADGETILTGTFAGDEFTAEAFDGTTDGTGVDATVAPGSCVVIEPNDTFGVLYVFAVGADGAWHRFLESNPAVPLTNDPTAQLDDIVQVTLEEGQTSDTPDLVPTGS
jgi:hypothetical protein